MGWGTGTLDKALLKYVIKGLWVGSDALGLTLSVWSWWNASRGLGMRKPGFTLRLSLFRSAILAGHLPSTPSSVFHLQNENKNLPKYLYNSDEKRSPQNTNQLYALSMCWLPFCFFFFSINSVICSPWLDPGLWSPSLSLLLSCSAVSISHVNQVPILARTVLYWAFLSVLFVVGRIW